MRSGVKACWSEFGLQYFRALQGVSQQLSEMLESTSAPAGFHSTSHQPHPWAPEPLSTTSRRHSIDIAYAGHPEVRQLTLLLLLRALASWLITKTLPAGGHTSEAVASASLPATATEESPSGGKAWAQCHRTLGQQQ